MQQTSPIKPGTKMPTAQEIKTTVENRLRNLLQTLHQKQAVYHAMNGRYWQGLLTHDEIPVDGAATAANMSRKPTDQEESWTDFGITLPANLEAAIQVDTYSSPAGDGYTVVVYIKLGANVWTRTANVGPERWRSKGWEKLEPNGV